MPKPIVLYPPPADVATFEHRYETEHAPMVTEKILGVTRFVAARVLGTPSGPAPYQRVAELYFDWIRSHAAGHCPAAGRRWRMPLMEISTGGPPVVLIAEDDSPGKRDPPRAIAPEELSLRAGP